MGLRIHKGYLIALFCLGFTITSTPWALKAENSSNSTILQELDALFLPSELNETLDSISSLSAIISITFPIYPIAEPFLFKEGTTTNDMVGIAAYQTSIYAGTIGLVYFSTELLKNAFHRTRPFPDDSEDPNKSFPSRHTSLSFAAAAFQSIFLSYNEANTDVKRALSASGWGLAVLTGFLRAASGEHFITDVLAGALIGTLIGSAGGILAVL